MAFFTFIGMAIVAMVAISYTKEKEIIRVSWNKVAEFLTFLTVLSIVRLAMFSFMLDMGLMKELPQVPIEILSSKWTLALVFWEDMFFGLPLYFIHKYMKNKWLKWTLTFLISALFGLGHMYQGLFAVLLLSLYPYFLSKKYGEKHGFGTVMMCHILYDNMTVYMIMLLPYLL
jgi:hypothetical protein